MSSSPSVRSPLEAPRPAAVLRAEWERLHAAVLRETDQRGWQAWLERSVEELSALLTAVSPPLPHPSAASTVPTRLSTSSQDGGGATAEERHGPALSGEAMAAGAAEDLDLSGGFEAPETFDDDGSDSASDADDGDSATSAAPPSASPRSPPSSSAEARAVHNASLRSISPHRFGSSQSSSRASSSSLSSPTAAASIFPQSIRRLPPGVTGRAERRRFRLSASAVAPGTPLSETLRRLRLHSDSDRDCDARQQLFQPRDPLRAEEALQPGEPAVLSAGAVPLLAPPPAPLLEAEDADGEDEREEEETPSTTSAAGLSHSAHRQSSSTILAIPRAVWEVEHDSGVEDGERAVPSDRRSSAGRASPLSASYADGCREHAESERGRCQAAVVDGAPEEDADDCPVIRSRRPARRRRLVADSDSDEDVTSSPLCGTQSAPTVAARAFPEAAGPFGAASPLRDVTNVQPLRGEPFSAKPRPPSSISCPFATPTAAVRPRAPHPLREPSTIPATDPVRRVLRSATHSGRKTGWRGVHGNEDFNCTPLLDRIRQHRLDVWGAPGRQQQLDRGGDELEACEQPRDDDGEQEGDDGEFGWIVDDGDVAVDSRGSNDSDEGSPLRPPPSRSPPPSLRTPSRALRCPSPAPTTRLTRGNRDALAHSTFAWLNSTAFSSLLPATLPLSWSTRLQTTAGFCSMLRPSPSAPDERRASIALAAKVVDSVEKLRLTLAHEMCHAAAWLVDGVSRPPHGRAFQQWARRCERAVPGLAISTCHRYDIFYPWRWACENADCAHIEGRHTDSLDVDAVACRRCGGRLARLGRVTRDGRPAKERTANAFAAFVQQHYAEVKRAEKLGTPHRVLMALPSSQYRRDRHRDEDVDDRPQVVAVIEEEASAADDADLVRRVLDMSVGDDERS